MIEQRPLGQTDIHVSTLCLGTMTWGEQNTEKEAHAQLDMALDVGINFIDTAEMYPVPPGPRTQGLTEQYLGSWLSKKKRRDNLVIASKVTGRSSNFNYLRGGETRLDKKNIEAALNESLKRLKTDYIDLYQLHWPDRKTNFFGQLGYTAEDENDVIALSETLGVLDKLIKKGKIRTIGLSNETPWGAMECLRLASEGLPRIVSIQNPYNLLNRSYEIGLAEVSIRESCGLLAYSPLAFGVLSGKYLNSAKPKNARLTLFDRFQRYINPHAQKATERYVQLAQDFSMDPVQMALCFVNTRPFLTSNIIGATTLEQLETNIQSAKITLPDEIYSEIDKIHTDIPNPCP